MTGQQYVDCPKCHAHSMQIHSETGEGECGSCGYYMPPSDEGLTPKRAGASGTPHVAPGLLPRRERGRLIENVGLPTTDPRDWDYRVVALIRAVDGDTFDLTIEKRMDFGFRLIEDKQWSTRFRLLAINAPETNEAGGAAATEFARDWINQAIADDVLRGQTFKTDNFGRWLIDLYRADNHHVLSNVMINEGHGKAYPTK